MDTNDPSLDEAALLQVAGRWLQALTEPSEEVVALAHRDGTVQYLSMNPAVTRITGFEALELAGKSLAEMVHTDDMLRIVDAFRQVANTPGATAAVEFRLRHREGHYVRLKSTAVNRLDDPVVRAVVVHSKELPSPDVPTSPVPTAENTIDQPYSLPPPTSTPMADTANLHEAVAAGIERIDTEPGYGFAVLLIELDRFKMLVGTYGGEVIESMLAEVGRRVMAQLRPQDTLARMGAGEFGVYLNGAGDRAQAARIAERMQKRLALRYRVGGNTITTSAIVGIATSERRYRSPEDVLRDASLAVNRARTHGRRRRAVFQTQMRVEDSQYMSLVGELHSALQANQLRLHYQPIISLATRTLRGFEALVRWYHPERNIISPVQFIPMAEETGLIGPMGRWILFEACRQAALWHQAYPMDPPLSVSVNLSPKQFADDDLQQVVEHALTDTALDPRMLALEITESAVLENPNAAIEVLNQLKHKGVKVSLDDFGTGYSSFSHLHKLPYDTLKIDRSFVSRIGDNGENTEIINAIIVLAHNLRLDVVAEGVETAAQATQLKNMWCEFAQGYFFAKPMEADQATALIASRPQW